MAISLSIANLPLPFTNLSLGRLGLSSRLARTATDISALKISSCKSIMRSTFSKACPKVIPRPFFFLIMRQAIKNEPWMQSLHGKCQKVCYVFPLLYFFECSSDTGRAKEGLDASLRWATYVTQSAPKWQHPTVLLSRQSSLDAWVVQRDGTNHPGAWSMAR
jgi:hypothetical protein